MVLVVPMYEEDSQASGIYYNTAAVIDADGTYLGKYRKTHIPHVKGFWEKYYFRPGNLGYPVFETAVGKVGVYICYDRHFPEGARALGLNGAEIVLIPSGHQPRPVGVPLADRAGQPRGRQRLLRGHDQPGRHRGRVGDDDFYGQSYFCDPRGQFVGAVGEPARRGAAHPRPGPGPDHRGAPDLAVLPRPPARRLRRPGPPLSTAAPTYDAAHGVRVHAQARPLHRADASRSPKQAEAAGFAYGWLFDCHVLWREPYPLLTLMAQATTTLRLGTCVTNPATREPTSPPPPWPCSRSSPAAGWTWGSAAATPRAGCWASRRPRSRTSRRPSTSSGPSSRAARSSSRAPSWSCRGRPAATGCRSGSPATGRSRSS